MAAALRAAAAVALLLAGCSPQFDWREVASAEGGFSAVLPAKPRHESRPLAGQTAPATMQLWSARAGATVFAVGFADYPGADRKLLESTRDALVANIGGTVTRQLDLAGEGWRGLQVNAEGRAGKTEVLLRLRLLLAADRLYQVAALGPPDAVPAEQLDVFFESFRLRARKS